MYVIYDCIGNSPFKIAGKNLLSELNLPFRQLQNESFLPNGGYYGRISNISKFIFANIYNIALVAKSGDILLALEEDSFCNLAFSLSLLESNNDVKEFARAELLSHGINIDVDRLKEYVAYLPFILMNLSDEIIKNVKFHFGIEQNIDEKENISEAIPSISKRFDKVDGFSTCLYYTGGHFDCMNFREDSKNVNDIFDLVGLKSLESSFSFESFTHLLEINKQKAFKKSGEILYAGIDLGVDFLCVFGNSSFDMFNKYSEMCARECGRDDIYIPIITLAQILLVSFGKGEKAGFDLHNINPLSLFENNFKVS